MTLNEWIKDYCSDNSIELPDDIPDNNTALNFLQLNTSGGGGGGSDISTYNIKIDLYDIGTDELVDYTSLDIGNFFTDEQPEADYALIYSFTSLAPENHIYKTPIIGDNILFYSDRNLIFAEDGENAWIPDSDAELIRSVSGGAVKNEDNSAIITGDCTITINVIQS